MQTIHSAVSELEKAAISKAIKECKGNLEEAAKSLGIGRATIYRKIKKYGLIYIRFAETYERLDK